MKYSCYLLAASLLFEVPALAQKVAPSPGIISPGSIGYGALNDTFTPVTKATPLPIELALTSAQSTSQEGTVTATAAAATSGAAAFAGGTATIGPLAPQLGRDIRVVLKGTWVGTVQIGTSSVANACAPGTINPLTIGGSTWGSYTANANEAVDTPTLAGIVYCATATITSGTLTYAVRQ